MLTMNCNLHEAVKMVMLNPPDAGGGTEDYVSLKLYKRWGIAIFAKNATTVTGSAITLVQATAVAGTGAKALPFTKAYRNIDVAAADALSEFAVSSNTFTTDATNSKQLMYYIPDFACTLDIAGGFDCISIGMTAATASVLAAVAFLWGGYSQATPPSAIID